MGVYLPRRLWYAALLGPALALAACSGNLGTGPGLPQGPQAAVSPAAGINNQSRTRTTEGAVYLAPDMNDVPFPDLGGYSLSLALGTPTPIPSSTPEPSNTGASKRKASGPAPAPSPTPSPTPSPATSPRPVASGGKPGAEPTGPKIDTKTTIFPENAPSFPTPKPTGNVQSFPRRVPIVVGYLMPHVEITLFSLASARFTVPAEELTSGRGFAIAAFEALKRKKTKLLASTNAPRIDKNTLNDAGATAPLKLKKNTGYYFVLYADEAVAPAAQTSYPPPGKNPFASPLPSGAPGIPVPVAVPSATPNPLSTPPTIPH